MNIRLGARVILGSYASAPATIIPDGVHIVSRVNDDGTIHVGGNTAVQPSRVIAVCA